MAAVSEARVSVPVAAAATDRAVVPVHRRRAVAVAVSPMELLRPESDLARLAEGFGHVDLLLAAEDVPASAPGTLGVLGVTPGHVLPEGDVYDFGDELDDDDDEIADDVREGAARLGLPDLHLHRLGLVAPLGPGAESDLVAAMSELVGFDPEAGVYCLAPAPAPSDPGRVVVDRAAQRIAQVYGIPLLRYRCLELSVVGEVAP